MSQANSQTLPTIYLPHGGGPCFFMDWDPPDAWHKMAAWLRSIAGSVVAETGAPPKAIVAISAHWEEPAFTVLGQAQPPLLYDYYGFPPHTYTLKYDAPGEPALAQQVLSLLKNAGFPTATNTTRGYDHGVFIPLKVAYPDADIPIVQLSLRAGLDPAEHLAMGRALAPLRQQGVLIIGSGMSYHNMRGLMTGTGKSASEVFDEWLTHTVELKDIAARTQALQHWSAAPGARAAHPREEHLIPLMVVAGAAEEAPGKRVYTDHVMSAQVSAYQFG